MDSAPPTKAKVLVVDDSRVVLRATRLILETDGYEVITQAMSFGTVGLIMSERPDVVLMDVQMSALNGDELTRIARHTLKSSQTRVLLYSDLPEEELARRAQLAGADGYIRKGLPEDEFLHELESRLAGVVG